MKSDVGVTGGGGGDGGIVAIIGVTSFLAGWYLSPSALEMDGTSFYRVEIRRTGVSTNSEEKEMMNSFGAVYIERECRLGFEGKNATTEPWVQLR